MAKIVDRKRVNFMIDHSLWEQLNDLVPAGKRSDFVNEMLDDALKQVARKIAFEKMGKFAKKEGKKLSTEDFLKTRNDGRL